MGFLSNLFGDPPQPPNPVQTATAQTASNIGTAIAGSYLNNYNQVTPTGNLTYTPDYSQGFVDPLTNLTGSALDRDADPDAGRTGNRQTPASAPALNLANTGRGDEQPARQHSRHQLRRHGGGRAGGRRPGVAARRPGATGDIADVGDLHARLRPGRQLLRRPAARRAVDV